MNKIIVNSVNHADLNNYNLFHLLLLTLSECQSRPSRLYHFQIRLDTDWVHIAALFVQEVRQVLVGDLSSYTYAIQGHSGELPF